MDTWLVVLILGQMGTFIVLLAIFAHYRQRTLDRRSSERLQILQRFDGTSDLKDLLEVPEGLELVRSLAPKSVRPQVYIIATTALGIVGTLVGIAFLGLYLHLGEGELAVPGAVGTAAGIGLLLASRVSFVLARRLGLFSDLPQEPQDETL